MKLIVYVLSALLLFSCALAGDSSKQDVSTSDLQNNSDIKDALKYGTNWIFEQAAKKYGISDKNIDVTQVNSIKKWEQKGATYYSFDVKAHNDDATITATYDVKCDDKGNFSIANKWRYTIDRNDNKHSDDYKTDTEVETPDAGTNVENDLEVDVETVDEAEVEEDNKCAKGDQVDASEVDKDSNLKDALDYGLNSIFKKAADKYGTSDKNIQITKINSICKWEDDGKTYYSFDVEAYNDDATITTTYNVKCDDNGNESLNKWRYTIDRNDNEHSDGHKTDTEVETPDAGTNVENDLEVDVETPGAGTNLENDLEVDVETVDEAEVEDNNKCAKGDQVDASEVDKDSNLKSALDYGLNSIFEKAADKYDTSDKNIQITQINSICKWEDDGKTYYSFDVEACNDDATITTTYTVKCDVKGNESLNKWSYTIDKQDNDKTDGHKTDTEVETPDAGTNVENDLEVDVETPDAGTNVENDLEVDVKTEEEEDSQDIEVDLEVTVEEEEENINKCENIDASQIDKDSHLKDALIHGINWIFQKAHDKFNLSTEDIVVTKINNLCGWKQDGNQYYSFDVEATNKNGDTVKTSFNVKCDSYGNLIVVNKWKYVIHFREENNENCEDQGTDTYEELEQDVEVEAEVIVSKCQQGDEVDVSEVNNDSDLKDALKYGIGWIFQNAADKYGVSDDSVEVNQINNICKWVEKGKTYYYFDVEATNNNDASVNATFNVKCDDNGSFDVANKWWYHIEYKDKTEDKNDDCGSPQEEKQDTDSYQNYGQDLEVTVEIDIEEDSKTGSYNN